MDHSVRCIHMPPATHQSCRSDCWLPEGGASVSGRQRMWSLLGIGLNILPWVIAAALLAWIRTSSFPGAAGAVMALG